MDRDRGDVPRTGPRTGRLRSRRSAAVARNTWVEVDVGSVAVAGTTLNLGIRTGDCDGGYFDSRESGSTAPQLVVTVPSDSGRRRPLRLRRHRR